MDRHRTGSQPSRFMANRHAGLRAFIAMIALLGTTSLADDAAAPATHFDVEMPAVLSQESATEIYQRINNDMLKAYALSKNPSAIRYQNWRRYNTSPYQSATHGSRYVNSYANAIAKDYDRLSDIDGLPVGAVLAKDSFAVTDEGNAFLGPLFLMEKMAAGFSAEGRDWRYSMIMPDGSYFGITGGDADEQVVFCRTCHQSAGDENDHLFFVPEAFRNQN